VINLVPSHMSNSFTANKLFLKHIHSGRMFHDLVVFLRKWT
jgi:hypothetical protein